MNTINFTRAKLEELERAYSAAVAKGQETFLFEGHELFVPYAKYLIEYLNHNFKPDVKSLKLQPAARA
jgi:hypothetical protein